MLVETEHQATRIAEAMRSEGLDGVPEPGQFVTLPMCISPCPRVALLSCNDVAANIVTTMLSSAPWTDAMTTILWNAFAGAMSQTEQQRLAAKIAAVVTSPPVLEFLRKRQQQRNG